MQVTFLEISSPDGPVRVDLTDEPLTIGRQIANRVVLEDTEASRFHCVIERVAGGAFRVRDLGSRNGTKVNGKLIKAHVLQNGDLLVVGRTEMRVVQDDGKPKIEPTTDQGRGLSFDGSDHVTQISTASPVDGLQRLAESLPDKALQLSDITLLNARGHVSHAGSQDTENIGEAVMLLRLLILVCFRTRASDVHVEPKANEFLVRIRVDGTMVDVAKLRKELGTRLCAAVKVLCDIDIAQRNIVQEGHFSSRVPDRRVDYRVSFTPSMYGQKLVMRVLDTANAPQYIWDLGMPDWMFKEIERAVRADQGMVLVCGPTGSGKTASLYAVLRSIDSGERNVVTIEDPVEIQIEGITQMPVDEERGNSFPNLLRSVLRQDPDVILVGEVRDGETAKVAMQAAMTGHLVFSTVHTRDSIGVIFRLIDLGGEPYMVSSALHLVLAQRLVRQLCPYCKVPMKPTPEHVERMGKSLDGVEKIFRANGCARCLQTGFAGRRAVFELLVVTDEIREIIMKNPTPGEITKALAGTKFTRLLQSGYQLVADGVTTMDEIERVVGT
jgi:general secretion pathway protein E